MGLKDDDTFKIKNKQKILKLFIDKKINLNIINNQGMGIWDFANTLNDPEILNILIENNINTSMSLKFKLQLVLNKIYKELFGMSPKETFELIKKTYFSQKTELEQAIESKDVKQLNLLIDKDPTIDLSNIILTDLVEEGYNFTFIEKVIRSGSNIDHRNTNGETALIIACQKNRIDIVKLLIKYGTNIEIKDKKGLVARRHTNNKEILKLLLNQEIITSSSPNPQKLVKVLTNFRKDTPIKYTTHIWDLDFKKEYGDFKGYISSVQEQWNQMEVELSELSPGLHTKIYNFLLNKTNTASWCSEADISIGWSSIDGLEDWCNSGKDPFKFKLNDQYVVDGKTISTFGEVIDLFKQEIQIRNENNVLENLFIDIEEKLDDELEGVFEIETIKLKGKSFYTDIALFKNALARIFNEIKKRPKFNHIRVEVAEDSNDKYIELKIMQIGSQANRSAQEMFDISDGGDNSVLKETLKNLCDWSIESSNEGENYRINYLKNNSVKDIEILDYAPEGFTHILRFYK